MPGEHSSERDVAQFSEGLAWVGIGFMDKTGELVIEAGKLGSDGERTLEGESSWLPDGNFHEGLARVDQAVHLTDGGDPVQKFGFIDREGHLVVQPQWDNAQEFSGGLAAVQRGGKWGFIDKAGRVVIPIEWDDDRTWHRFSEGLAPVERVGKWGFIDKTGNTVIALRWENALWFHEGLAAVKLGGKWGFINKTGNTVIALQWEEVAEFHEGLAAVQRGGKWGFVDKSGRVAISPTWDDARDFSEGTAVVGSNDKWGLIDKNGKMVIPPELPAIEWSSGYMIKVPMVETYRGHLHKGGRSTFFSGRMGAGFIEITR